MLPLIGKRKKPNYKKRLKTNCALNNTLNSLGEMYVNGSSEEILEIGRLVAQERPRRKILGISFG